MTAADIQKLAIAGAILYAGWKFGPAAAKGAILGVAGIVVAKRIPYVQDVI